MPGLYNTKRLYAVLFLMCGIALAIGWLLNAIWPLLFGGCLVLLLWHFQQLCVLDHWLWHDRKISPPDGKGIWGNIFDGLYHKIRHHRAKQRNLLAKLKLFRDGAEALPDAAIVLDKDLAIVWANKKAQQLIGVDPKADVGQRISNLVRSPDFQQYLAAGDYNFPCSISSPINESARLEFRIMAYGADQCLMLVRDISQLHKLNTMRRDFVANVSHELKTPLTVIKGYVEMLQMTEQDDQQLPPAFMPTLSTIDGQVNRMHRLVEQLLELSKVEINQSALHKTLNLSTLCQSWQHELVWLNQNKQHCISFNIEPDIMLVGSETELKSACMNLIANAIAYTQKHGEIKVSLTRQSKHIRFAVKDNGPGIEPEHINRLTERFYRIDPSRSRNTGGSGLGLSIVKHVLQHHHAQLQINSSFGEGSEFVILFDQPEKQTIQAA